MHDTEESVDPALVEELRAQGLIDADAHPRFFRIPGGVSANVWRVEVADRRFCVKQALEQLRVADTWYAPTSRWAAEAAWLRRAGSVGLHVPTVLAELPDFNASAMSWIETGAHSNWKQQLLAGEVDAQFAAALGHDIGLVHRVTAGQDDVAAEFDNADSFEALRTDPYFVHSIAKNPQVADQLQAVINELREARIALVHGDVTPKNILVDSRPVILDAEVATYGDPAFDAALCATHLLLKCAWRQERTADYLAALHAFTNAWRDQVDWEPLEQLERRFARLIAAMLIARIDGKSPADYLIGHPARDQVRAAGHQMLSHQSPTFDVVITTWQRFFDNEGTTP